MIPIHSEREKSSLCPFFISTAFPPVDPVAFEYDWNKPSGLLCTVKTKKH